MHPGLHRKYLLNHYEFGNDRVGNGAEVGIVDKGEFIRRYEDPQASFLNYLYQR